jgi:hypothetical protein
MSQTLKHETWAPFIFGGPDLGICPIVTVYHYVNTMKTIRWRIHNRCDAKPSRAEELRGQQSFRRWNECEKGCEPGNRAFILG